LAIYFYKKSRESSKEIDKLFAPATDKVDVLVYSKNREIHIMTSDIIWHILT